jgi:hypothetical protein
VLPLVLNPHLLNAHLFSFHRGSLVRPGYRRSAVAPLWVRSITGSEDRLPCPTAAVPRPRVQWRQHGGGAPGGGNFEILGCFDWLHGTDRKWRQERAAAKARTLRAQ